MRRRSFFSAIAAAVAPKAKPKPIAEHEGMKRLAEELGIITDFSDYRSFAQRGKPAEILVDYPKLCQGVMETFERRLNAKNVTLKRWNPNA